MLTYIPYTCLVRSLLCMLCLVLTGGAAAAAAAPPVAGAPPLLFANLAWGASKETVMRLPEMAQARAGEDEFNQDLIVHEVRFAALPWAMRLAFTDNKLSRVSLMAPYSRERMQSAIAQLKTEHYEMLSVLVDNTQLDCVEILKREGPTAVREKLVPLLSKNPAHVVYAWFQVATVSQEIKTMASGLKNLLMSVPIDTREAEIVMVAGEDGKPALLLVEFSFPLL